jgi:serine/threonine protein kinase
MGLATTGSLSDYLKNKHVHHKFETEYQLGGSLGRGGFGFVVAVTHMTDMQQSACKFIVKKRIRKSRWVHDPTLGKCPIEVWAAHNLQHDNLLEFVDYFEDETYCYLVTTRFGSKEIDEYLPPSPVETRFPKSASMDLFQYLSVNTRMSERDCRHVMNQLMSCVEYLYHMNLIHRDIKDENILIDSSLDIKLVDLGSITAVGDGNFDNFLGTLQYAAPEIVRCETYSAESAEIWSIGCLMYIMLTGELPFMSPRDVLDMPVRQPTVKLGFWARELVMRMLDKDPKGRPSIQDVINHPFLDG